MKTKKSRIILTICLAVLMLLPLIAIPAGAEDEVTWYVDYDFEADNASAPLTLGMQGSAMQSYFKGKTIPSTATVVADPLDPDNQVIQISTAPVATGLAGYDYVIYSSGARAVTWNAGTTTDAAGNTVYSGTFVSGNYTYYVQSTDEKQKVTIADQTGPSYTVTSDTITYSGASYTVTWDAETSTDFFGNTVYYGLMANGTAAYRVKSLDNKATAVVISKNASYVIYDDKATLEAIAGGDNIDKNLCVMNQGISYSANKTGFNYEEAIILSTDYYIPTGTKGSVEVQMCTFDYFKKDVEGAEEISTSWLHFYNIDLTAARIRTTIYGNSAREYHDINRDTWVNISLAINMVTGWADLYIDHVLVQSGQMMHGGTVAIEKLTFDANMWNIAKVNKSYAPADGVFGEFYVDNAYCHSYNEDTMKRTFTKAPDTNGNAPLYVDVVTATGHSYGASFDDTVLLDARTTATIQYLTPELTAGALAPVKGASIRLSGSGGIRFATQVNTEKLNALYQLEKDGKVASVDIGTLITPYSYVAEAGAFTKEALEALDHTNKYVDVQAGIGYYYNTKGLLELDEGYDNVFVGSLINIKPANISRTFTAVGYIKFTLLDGTEEYVYSYDYADMSSVLENDYSRNISSVAALFVNDPKYVDYKELLQGFIKGLTVPSLSSNIINNVQYTAGEFFFQNAEGTAMRLSYNGVSGWRFQAVPPKSSSNPYSGFDNIGAGQSLALYMGEGYKDETNALTVEQIGDHFYIYAKNTESYVTLSTTGSFAMTFYSPEGKVMSTLTNVTADGKNVKITGELIEDEAIYGGGQRFESANKVGKMLTLFSFDAYNTANGTGTYTVVPLFTSSRGSGFFINRYELMTADIGATDSGAWTIDIENDLIDVYFYAEGKITDALNGYVNISGHPTLPEEWAQGTLICRYAPDFSSLEGETVVYESLTDIPNYESLTLSYQGTDFAIIALANGTLTDGKYLYNGKNISYLYRDGLFYRTTKKGNPAGYGVKDIVTDLMEAGLKPQAIIMEATDGTWMNSTSNDSLALSNRQLLKDIVDWLDQYDIKCMLYQGVGGLSTNMAGIKREYWVSADVTWTITQASTNTCKHSYGAVGTKTSVSTIQIPKTAATDNPDSALSGATQAYLDITNPEAVEWYMNELWGALIDVGFDGCKIDFCETMPNSETTLKALNTTTGEYEEVGSVVIDYKWYDPTVFEGDDIHHAYTTFFTALYHREMTALKEAKMIDDGFTLLTRGGGIGAQRAPLMWAGDQTRNESNLKTQLVTLINSGLSGIPFMTYDMAGYAYDGTGGYYSGALGSDTTEVNDTESKIYLRAIQFTAFTTALQTHGDVRNVYDLQLSGYEEGYVQKIAQYYTDLHQDIMPYLRACSEYACETGIPMVRHLILNYQDDINVRNIEDQFMLGDALMVAPILDITSTSRSVYLPEGEWINLLTGEIYSVDASGLTVTVDAELDQIALFLNTEAEGAEDLLSAFNGASWQAINGGILIGEIPAYDKATDPYGEDVF